MSTDAPQAKEDVAAAEAAPRKGLLVRIRPAIPDWRPAAKKAAGAIAAVAAVGAVLGGLVGFWSTYKVVVGEWLGQKPTVVVQAKSDAPAAFNPPRRSIALMPLDNLSGDASQDYFGDGIVENLTTELSVNVPDLLVIARGSAFSYKGHKIDPTQVGRELNVRYLLQGSVQRTGSQVRINARLVDAETGEQLWADRFDGETSNILGLQDQIAARISNSLRLAFVTAGARQAQKHANPDAFDLVLRAQAALFEEYRQGINPRKVSVGFYRKALEIDPDNTNALTGLSLVLAENVYNSRFLASAARPTPETLKANVTEVGDLLGKAARLASQSDEAHYARARLAGYDQKWDDAQRELEAALAINPSRLQAQSMLADVYNALGRPERALTVLDEYQLRTAGKNPGRRTFLFTWGFSFMLLGRWDESVRKFQEAQALRNDAATEMYLAAGYAELGSTEAAKTSFQIWRDWRTATGGAPTMKSITTNFRLVSQVPDFLKLIDRTLFDGLRKLGLPEE